MDVNVTIEFEGVAHWYVKFISLLFLVELVYTWWDVPINNPIILPRIQIMDLLKSDSLRPIAQTIATGHNMLAVFPA